MMMDQAYLTYQTYLSQQLQQQQQQPEDVSSSLLVSTASYPIQTSPTSMLINNGMGYGMTPQQPQHHQQQFMQQQQQPSVFYNNQNMTSSSINAPTNGYSARRCSPGGKLAGDLKQMQQTGFNRLAQFYYSINL